MAQESQAEEQQLIFGAVWIEGTGKKVGRGDGVAGDCISVSLNIYTINKPSESPRMFWLAKTARGLSSMAEPR